MRYLRREVRTEWQEESIAEFLFGDGLASTACHQLDSSPGALLLDHLVPSMEPGEVLEDWFCRQVREILLQYIQTDNWEGGAGRGIRTQCAVENLELSASDRQWLIVRYARHPEVLATWEEAGRREQAARLAA